MKYYSTHNPTYKVNLQEAVIKSLAPDNGLFMPERIPVFPAEFFASLHEKTFAEIAFEVVHTLLGNDIPVQRLKKIVEHTITFDAPLVEIENDIFVRTHNFNKTAREFYRDNRDVYLFYLVLAYFLNIVDAYVDAHLFDFDVSEDKFTKGGLRGKEYRLKFNLKFW